MTSAKENTLDYEAVSSGDHTHLTPRGCINPALLRPPVKIVLHTLQVDDTGVVFQITALSDGEAIQGLSDDEDVLTEEEKKGLRGFIGVACGDPKYGSSKRWLHMESDGTQGGENHERIRSILTDKRNRNGAKIRQELETVVTNVSKEQALPSCFGVEMVVGTLTYAATVQWHPGDSLSRGIVLPCKDGYWEATVNSVVESGRQDISCAGL